MSTAGGHLIGEAFETYIRVRTTTHDRLLQFRGAGRFGSYDEALLALLALADGKGDPASRGLLRHDGAWRYRVLCALCPFERSVRGQERSAHDALEQHWTEAHGTPAPEG